MRKVTPLALRAWVGGRKFLLEMLEAPSTKLWVSDVGEDDEIVITARASY